MIFDELAASLGCNTASLLIKLGVLQRPGLRSGAEVLVPGAEADGVADAMIEAEATARSDALHPWLCCWRAALLGIIMKPPRPYARGVSTKENGMPARVTELVERELDLDESTATAPTAAGAVASLQRNTVLLYEHKKFEERGRRRLLAVTQHQPQLIFSMHVMDFKDCLSSLRWNLDPGIVVQLHEHHDGGGRQYQIWGSGEDADTHNNGFGDRASSWSWYRIA